ncbi:Glycosyltransferase, catalytic subunit of cellulose synthase and poly-beta-1,6-N-acetylglucosamine synthase [Selenomonas sp. WCT3]|uniref:glycosyltransferase family 2 protein n=1 Tax=Selenomonas sp. WCT3 TaxID=3158785 RepID=UPI0008815257|nr:Glycosyltransferase, catalytic subunit of cellulose synthase and poly-beta-1,6-N-acetylglucosamine synthase [Selenomonas ruminantium]
MKVSIAIVAYNEEAYLNNILADIVQQSYPLCNVELLLIDSMSTDETYNIMKKFKMEYGKEFFSIKLLKNEGKRLPNGCNVALENYTGDVILRIDAHARIPIDFIKLNVETIKSGECVCGGPRPNIIEKSTKWKKMLLAAEMSKFGSGAAPFRNGQKRSYVTSVFHGCYKREVFQKIGKYDERLARTEDNDIHYRMRLEGYKICFNPFIKSYQYIRPSLKKMLMQKYANGYWIGRTIYIQPKCFSWYHFIPMLFVSALLLSLFFSHYTDRNFLAYLLIIYFSINIFICVKENYRKIRGNYYLIVLPVIVFFIHILYGLGEFVGLIKGLRHA